MQGVLIPPGKINADRLFYFIFCIYLFSTYGKVHAFQLKGDLQRVLNVTTRGLVSKWTQEKAQTLFLKGTCDYYKQPTVIITSHLHEGKK